MTAIGLPLSLLTFIALGFLLTIGKPLLVPLVIAVFFWYMINAIADAARPYIKIKGRGLARLFGLITFGFIIWIPINLIANTIPEFAAAAPQYEDNVRAQINEIVSLLPMDMGLVKENFISKIDFGAMVSVLANGITGFASNAFLIVIYLAFLLAEQGSFRGKIEALSSNKAQRDQVQKVLADIYTKIRSYIIIKTAMSLATGVASYVIMRVVGLDFAAFWAILIFFLNYIPSLGSIIGTIFPALFALIQFNDISTALVLTAAVGAVQVVIGNVVEPKAMGNSLNLSPLVILLSLVLWGSIWGITGMYLAVPIMVILLIIFAQFASTRPIAVLLSANGKVD